MGEEAEFELVDVEEVESPGDEWEEIDVTDTEADRIARKRDREFEQFETRIKDADQFKVEQSVFDDATFAALYKLVQDGHVEAFGGPLSTGKEANVYHALGDDRDVAVKVYRINASNFRQMREYLEGDPRFEGLGGKKKDVVLAWTKKELANLERARKAGVRVPEPIAVERNVLVMEYIGNEEGRAKRLGEVHIENPQTAYEVMREYMRRLYAAGIIHGDLSEYNVVFNEGQLVIIDVGQAVTVHHPNSRDFLERDCTNVANFFSRQGLETDPDELLEFVTDPDPDPSRD
ncbi:serine/threonine-protein kinase Rio1 [Natrarchaeobaculum sulfurireducens]|uniref:non-specific serine/threonine protein kinase n=1 Tax=Natrarchaeobaculum sulfurireducens TaxID=2044521 RepID=A0A346PIZ5_9EURY|nr:serine/threonine-protein kinase Rio1 [Natrarchaeobaculum sulfurireducens]AXR79490.1 Serine/threonine protein kinase [Natrarchaeobaculum sulfurireducens]AXR83257.1 Serine/threonine-protein kinase [Natrarchaeobaculum sulfurireducens]